MRKPRCQNFRRLRGFWIPIQVLAFAGGCASHLTPSAWKPVSPAPSESAVFERARATVSGAFPSVYQAVQRAIITVRERQFVCDGFLTVAPADGWHLAIVSSLGLVTEVRVKSDGSSEVLKVTPLLQEVWARSFVCRELRWLFVPPQDLADAGRLSDGRILLETASATEAVKARYVCSSDGSRWEELEVLSGARPIFHARIFGYRSFADWTRGIPAEIELEAGTHRLHLRIAAMQRAAVSSGGPR